MSHLEFQVHIKTTTWSLKDLLFSEAEGNIFLQIQSSQLWPQFFKHIKEKHPFLYNQELAASGDIVPVRLREANLDIICRAIHLLWEMELVCA